MRFKHECCTLAVEFIGARNWAADARAGGTDRPSKLPWNTNKASHHAATPFFPPSKLGMTWRFIYITYTGQHCNENPIYVFLSWELRGLSPSFHIHVSVSDSYIPRIGLHIFFRRNGRSIERIYKSLTDTWMWKLRLRQRNSFSGNICFEFSVLCLCSGLYYT